MNSLTYVQRTGCLYRGEILIGVCYAGNGTGLNNPALQDIKNVGPLPAGRYTLRAVVNSHKGGRVFNLLPSPGNLMHGRDKFMIHYDTPDRTFRASAGCIVPLFSEVFSRIGDGDQLTVIPDR